MCNIKKLDFYDAITGEKVSGTDYGINASTFKNVDNVDMIFDSRGKYLGIRTSRGKFEKGIYIIKKGPYDFKSFSDLDIWEGQKCSSVDFIETKDGTFMQVDLSKQNIKKC